MILNFTNYSQVSHLNSDCDMRSYFVLNTGVTGEVTAHAKNNLATWMLEHPLEDGEGEEPPPAVVRSSRRETSLEERREEGRRRLRAYGEARSSGELSANKHLWVFVLFPCAFKSDERVRTVLIRNRVRLGA